MSRTTIVKSHVLHVKLSFTYTNVLPVNTIIVIIYINQFTLDKTNISYNFRSKELQVRDNDSSIVCIILQANLILPVNFYYYYQTITNSNSQIL